MRSIRLTLILYFLLLLAAGLGAVSGLVYWTTERIVLGREQATEQLVRSQYAQREQEERQTSDELLLQRARSLASHVQFRLQGSRTRYQNLSPLGLLTAGIGPSAHLAVPLWAGTGIRGALYYRLQRLSGGDIQFPEEELDDTDQEFSQVTMEWGNTWRSPSLGEQSLLDPRLFPALGLFEWIFEDLELEGKKARAVSLKVPLSRFQYVGPTWFYRGPPPRAGGVFPPPPPPDRERIAENSAPSMIIQVASLTAVLDQELARQQNELARELQQLAIASGDTLSELRRWLWIISLATFAATVVGGLGLVWLGLLPLRRLSDAVSQVSEKDFRLPLDERHLPRELQPIAARLTQTLGQLGRAFDREKQAAADISHELRTPLAALLTTTEVALRKPRSGDEYRQHLDDCRQIGQQMSQLVERLLALARLDAGVDTLRPSSVDAAALAKQCADLIRPLADARALRLQVHAEGPAAVPADPDKLREVVINLLHNAVEYNRPEGSVDLTVARANGHLLLEVRDTGIGISLAARAHIFERFYRADPAREATGLHAGLGLAIVKGYVDLMGGDIEVESREGEGSTFRVRLPASSGQ